ncbi:transposase [Carboxylicivirga mesophila]|uniref:Transposase n=1 Tax=Carboxylicivirga mesophila TaxID=1166478 RepID=A0ABS5KJB3_9BACT|nr:transposase [Carboxylicivirga mesophila]MBS2213993.1 transposase [Carboxylicivirga mesophila]
MKNPEPLITNHLYHIYNRGINSCNIFESEENYEYFLNLYEKHIEPIAKTFAWVLMPNHFHLLVQIRGQDFEARAPHQCFSNFFNAYSKAFNKFHNRHGALFERPFKRKQIDNSAYFKKLVIYIHQNPVHHGFCEHPLEYGWSSYLTCISSKSTKFERDEVIKWFGGGYDFECCHKEKINSAEINEFLGI